LKIGNGGLYFVGLVIGARRGRGGFRQNGMEDVKRIIVGIKNLFDFITSFVD